MIDPLNPDYRISDAEREQAIEDLGAHFAQGRLSLSEYEQRVTIATSAVMRSDISELFDDLPTGVARSQMDGRSYSAAEISSMRKSGMRTRVGLFGLATVGMLVTLDFYESFIPVAIWASIFILLFVMKIGPQSWYTPAPRALERQRMREVRMAQQQQMLESKAVYERQRAEQKAIRQQKTAELNNAALDLTNDILRRFKR